MAKKDLEVQGFKIVPERRFHAELSSRRDLRKTAYSAQNKTQDTIFRLCPISRERIPGYGETFVTLEFDEIIPRTYKDLPFSFRWFVGDAVDVYAVEPENHQAVACTNYMVVKVVNRNKTPILIEDWEILGMVVFERPPKKGDLEKDSKNSP